MSDVGLTDDEAFFGRWDDVDLRRKLLRNDVERVDGGIGIVGIDADFARWCGLGFGRRKLDRDGERRCIGHCMGQIAS